MSHPDEELKVGTTRQGAGLTWKLYKNQFGMAWKAGPRAVNLRVHTRAGRRTSVNTDGYRLGDTAAVTYGSFEKAAQAAVDLRRKQYAEARKLIDDYDNWDERL